MTLNGRFAGSLLLLASLSVWTGCSAETTEEEESPVAGEDEVVSERQLMGGELPDKTVSLTFDDGPGPRTAELAEFLGSQGIHATFFINGKNVPGRQAAIQAIVANGHLLANHTQNHLQLTKLSADKVVSEIRQTDAIIAQAQPSGPFVLRAPFGAWTGNTARAVSPTDMNKYIGSVFWDIGGELTATTAADWACWGKGVAVQRCGELYMSEVRTRKRGIVLMHDVHDKTVDMVKTVVVPKLVSEGFKFAKLEDVPSVKRALGATGTQTNNGCYSASIGKSVDEGGCIQSVADQKWYRCAHGEWSLSSATDTACKTRVGAH